MISAIHELLRGRQRVARRFNKAHKLWKEFHKAHKKDSIIELAKALTNAQFAIESCFDGDSDMGKSCMAYTCLGALYDEANGFRNMEYANRILQAFDKSMCSMEVKMAIPKVRALYMLD